MLASVAGLINSRYASHSLLITLGLVLSSCGGGSSGSTSEAAPGEAVSTRAASLETVTNDGDTLKLSYTYDDNGRLIASTFLSNGVQTLSRTYSYSEGGLVTTRLTDYVDEEEKDALIEYVYNGDDIAGYYSSFVGEQTDALLQYEYASGRIVGYEQRTIDPPVDEPTLSMGELFRTGTYAYDDLGFISRTTASDADGNLVRQSDYDVATNGQRLSHQTFDGESNLLSTTTWTYETAPCVEFPWSITQYICVQIEQ